MQVHRKPINIGESLVASNLQSAVKAAGAKPKPFLVTAFATPPVSAGNTPRSNPNTSALESLLRGLGRESTMDESSASLAGKVAAALSESQLLDSTEEEKKIDDDEDAISENDTDYEDNAEEKSEQGDAEEAGKPKVNPQEEVSSSTLFVISYFLVSLFPCLLPSSLFNCTGICCEYRSAEKSSGKYKGSSHSSLPRD